MLSPVGALSNGLELLADEKDPVMRKHCFDLLEQSARISADKLKFFRLAFGAAGGFGDLVPVNEARSADRRAGRQQRSHHRQLGAGQRFAAQAGREDPAQPCADRYRGAGARRHARYRRGTAHR
jgi:hypothetical protein